MKDTLPLMLVRVVVESLPYDADLQNEVDGRHRDRNAQESCQDSMDTNVAQFLEKALLSHVVTVVVKDYWNCVVEQSHSTELMESSA